MYTYLVDQYLFFDRESDLSLLLWGMQLFPVPAIATAAVRDMDILHTLLQVLTSFFTEQFEHQHLRIPPMVVPRISADVEAFRTKKWHTMFGHLKVMLQSKGVQKILLEQPEAYNEVVSFLSLFTAMSPQIRVTTEHIEYESEAWIRALGVTMDLSRITISLGHVFDRANKEGLIRAITEVGLHISYNSRLLSTVLDAEKFFPPQRQVIFLFGTEFEVILHDASIEWVSIHNPLHWALAEAIKRLPALIQRENRDGSAERTTRKDIMSWVTASNSEVTDALLDSNMQITMENPLRSEFKAATLFSARITDSLTFAGIAYLAQVRAGLWVRNGIGMRGQLHHYRDHPLRETTYDQDLFLLQFGFSTLDPAVMLASAIDRFGLTELFVQGVWTEGVHNAQVLQLLEELLLCLITLFSETWAMHGHTRIETSRREIVHLLCLGPLSFSDLTKRLSERTVEISSFKDVLEQVATLRHPHGVTETGIYELKDEYYDQINPLFYHYSRNQQNSAYEILCKRRKKTVVALGHPNVPSSLPFSHLLDVFETPFIMFMLHVVLHNAIDIRNRSLTSPSAPIVPQLDGLIDLAFHLASLALACSPEVSSRIACESNEQFGYSPLISELCEIETDKNWQPYRPRISNLIESIAKLQDERVQAFRTRPSSDKSSVSAEDARKAAIAKHKQAILAGFAKNQVAFAEAYSVEDEEEEDDEADNDSYGQCIVCQESCTATRASGLLGIIQPSKVVRNLCVGRDWLEECLRIPETLDADTRQHHYGLGTDGRPVSTDAYPRQEQRFGLNVTVCGHLMHEGCLAKFFEDTRLRQHQQGQRNHPENVFRQEFVCPLCKSVGNVLIPLSTKQSGGDLCQYRPLSEWIRRTLDEDLRRQGDKPDALAVHPMTGERIIWFTEHPGEADMDFLDDQSADTLIRYFELVHSIAQQTSHIHGRPDLGLYMPKDVVAYTLSMMEIQQRGIASTEGNSAYLNESSGRLLRGLVHMLYQEEQTKTGEPADPLLNRIHIFSTLLPERFRTRQTSSALLQRDPLITVVETATLAPEVLQPVMVLCYYAELVRAILAIPYWVRSCTTREASSSWSKNPADMPDQKLAMEMFPEPRQLIFGLFRYTPQLLQEATAHLSPLPERELSKLLYTFTLPFLRRCSMLCSALDMRWPTAGSDAILGGGEYGKHLRRLRIPLPSSTLLDVKQPIHSTTVSWLKQWIHLNTGLPIILPTLEFPGIYELYRIPKSLESLLRYYEKRKCSKCKKVPTTPAICMFCGEYLCLGLDCCSEGSMGECNLHRME
jgi:E3 ubiquitin-protein ligase UBR1